MRGLACLLLLMSCAAQRLERARATGATAMACAAEDLWVFEDDLGWAASGCGQIVTGTESGRVAERSKATCAGMARFEFRLCRAIVRQSRPSGGPTTNIAAAIAIAQSENACDEQLNMRLTACPPEPFEPVKGYTGNTPLVPGEIPPNP